MSISSALDTLFSDETSKAFSHLHAVKVPGKSIRNLIVSSQQKSGDSAGLSLRLTISSCRLKF